MALFGYPVAQENDAERAVRAALSIQRALAELNRKNEGTGKPALAARIAIDTGPAVLDAAGEIFGDVANIAARAQALADPGAVVVTARVQRHERKPRRLVRRPRIRIRGVKDEEQTDASGAYPKRDHQRHRLWLAAHHHFPRRRPVTRKTARSQEQVEYVATEFATERCSTSRD
jgi:class 3 adenylate cyclase